MSVYVIQRQQKFNESTGQLESKFDLSTAEDFGLIIYLLSPTARPFSSEHVISELHEKLQYFTNHDYLLLIGNPCLIGFAVAIAARYNEGYVRVLQWSGTERKYLCIEANLRFPERWFLEES